MHDSYITCKKPRKIRGRERPSRAAVDRTRTLRTPENQPSRDSGSYICCNMSAFQLTETCTWSKWFCVGSPRSSIGFQLPPGIQMRCCQMTYLMLREPALA